jgi:hypothetical protein
VIGEFGASAPGLVADLHEGPGKRGSLCYEGGGEHDVGDQPVVVAATPEGEQPLGDREPAPAT